MCSACMTATEHSVCAASAPPLVPDSPVTPLRSLLLLRLLAQLGGQPVLHVCVCVRVCAWQGNGSEPHTAAAARWPRSLCVCVHA
jgi:hypothetical protein